MKPISLTVPQFAMAAVALVILASGIGYGIAGLQRSRMSTPAPAASGKVLYWYDPMSPGQHFDHPGKSPFMDMPLVPKYADGAGASSGVKIDTAAVQNLGVRFAVVRRGSLAQSLDAPGTVDFNDRDVAIVQAKAAGFVQRVYARAPGDVVSAGAPLADLLVPEWGGAQTEYLAVRKTGDLALTAAARQRLTLLGMPAGLISEIERSGRPRSVVTVSTPVAGVIKTLGVRAGMTVSANQTLAEVNGLSTVWVNVAVPEAQAGTVRVGQAAIADFSAYPGRIFTGRVSAILPEAQTASRTLQVRVELPNRGGALHPGMFATVHLASSGARSALLVPSEAVIRTGRRTLVMVALEGGHFQPAEVETGAEFNGETEILSGLQEGERIVASGQFLIDSEANLSGTQARTVDQMPGAPAAASGPPAVYETQGRVEALSAQSITLSHGPVPQIGLPAMTMAFRLANPALARGLNVGDRVAFGFTQDAAGPTVRSLSKMGAAQ
jgi:Cu(I)/Ag(I) efflux system membrane fusion protein